ncbi:hypothetical protein RchiOBHm_Chr3g0494751 [Rosa chinensis]|uniref:Transmembrane protein n=1 Tax=Rosa chinensis TaxID=74649 RepID=A0A2P6RH25_ROSCH|nr:hypothetical protein RchiOBHm_Chr3g0494751 [Rosa chinensis]
MVGKPIHYVIESSRIDRVMVVVIRLRSFKQVFVDFGWWVWFGILVGVDFRWWRLRI